MSDQKKRSYVAHLILIFVLSRLALEVVGLLSLFYFPSARALFPIRDLNYHTPQPATLEMWARWDSEWYLLIADKGYQSYEYFREAAGGRYLPENTGHFFPAYPLAIRLLTYATGNSVLSAFLISNVCALLFLYYLFRLGSVLFDTDSAFQACLYVVFFPTSLFLSAAYSESLFLAALAASFLYIEEKRFGLAAVAAAILTVTRPHALVAVPAILWLAYRKGEGRQWKPVLLLAGAMAIPLLAYFWYVSQAFGSVSALFESVRYWRGESAYPFYALVRFFTGDIAIHGQHNSMIDFSFAALHLLVLALSIRTLPGPYYLYSILVVVLPLSSTLFSFSRLCLANLPFFLYLGYRIQGRWAYTWQIVSAMLLAFFMAAFANWFWVA